MTSDMTKEEIAQRLAEYEDNITHLHGDITSLLDTIDEIGEGIFVPDLLGCTIDLDDNEDGVTAMQFEDGLKFIDKRRVVGMHGEEIDCVLTIHMMEVVEE